MALHEATGWLPILVPEAPGGDWEPTMVQALGRRSAEIAAGRLQHVNVGQRDLSTIISIFEENFEEKEIFDSHNQVTLFHQLSSPVRDPLRALSKLELEEVTATLNLFSDQSLEVKCCLQSLLLEDARSDSTLVQTSNFVTATDTFQEFVDAGESELSVCEEASTDDAIVAAVRGSAEVATDDESDGEDDVDPTPEPDFPCKDALEYLAKVKTYCAKNSLSEKSLQCLSFVEDEIVRSAVRKHRQTKITAFFR
ncbi:hypothetical protein HPB50_018432 [Hyalomma asiaticum]|uniref:Uncharacterized protein n=1 Tax=Hyalomma asiaticum TaxID=266040 RepID=A0ACB7S1S1_HYAAI|nr:hypothetical protein HPB50_018432 [Hyalomma asiaticum]